MNRVANTSLLQRSTQSFHGPRPWMEGGKVLVGGFPTNVVNTRGRIFVDKVSGTRSRRPGLEACLGDVLLVWCLDRLGRSMIHLVDLVEQLRDRSVGFRSLCDGSVDTTTASGELVFHIFSALAQFERRLIQERTKAGLAAARARGRKGGRKPISPNDPRVQTAKTMHRDKEMAIGNICKTLGISRSTFYRYLAMSD
jgi:DNA invertase Pin-like site-specific DNA recombinase